MLVQLEIPSLVENQTINGLWLLLDEHGKDYGLSDFRIVFDGKYFTGKDSND